MSIPDKESSGVLYAERAANGKLRSENSEPARQQADTLVYSLKTPARIFLISEQDLLVVCGAAALNIAKMISQVVEYPFAVGVATPQCCNQFIQGKVDDVVMMKFFRSHLVAQIEPSAMKQIDLFLRQVRCVRAEVADVLLTFGGEDFQVQVRPGKLQPFPGKAADSRFLRQGMRR